jgi:hypothetical protein
MIDPGVDPEVTPVTEDEADVKEMYAPLGVTWWKLLIIGALFAACILSVIVLARSG